MKLLAKTLSIALLGLLVLGSGPAARAQLRGGAPGWGPRIGPNTRYYYLPELDAYYDLYNQAYLFFDGYSWVSSYALPPAYAGFDPYQFHPVPLAYVGPQPWRFVQRYPQCVAPYRRYYRQPRVVVVQPYRGQRGGYGYNRGHHGYSHPGYRHQARGYDNRDYGRNDRREYDRRGDNRRGDAYSPAPAQNPAQGRDNGHDGRQGRFPAPDNAARPDAGTNADGSYGHRGRVR